MNRPFKVLPKNFAGPLRYRPQPSWIPPMLATLTEQLPTEGKWIYEPKLDGVRGMIYVSGGVVRIYSRNRKPLNDAYPELVDALGTAVRGDAVLDGEVVVTLEIIDATEIQTRRRDTFLIVDLFRDFFRELIDSQGLSVIRTRKAQVAEGNQFSA